ncbi:hypothetical protein MAR_011415 [Mya arenaria]|uniref:SUEL-type lectin domain-containing protein n=1 Tax=Mya arenaria TaxID=6604 RepID=A0ABY7FY10_MYAAR|nr:hypothetical protein MAR_011415 [Mya arenaria]
MIFFVQLLAFHIVHGTFALGTLYKSTASCFGVISPASNSMSSSCPPGEVIAIKTFTVAYKAAALNCTLDSVRIQNQFQLCCSNITEQDCQMSYNIHPNNAVQYIEKCNGRRSCNVMATVVLPQDCIGVPDHYPNYMHINYYCIPETGILSSMSGTITSTSLGQHVYLQSPGFNNSQKIPSGKTLTCSVHTCDMGSKLSITLRQIVMENNYDDHHQSNNNNGFNIYTNDADHHNHYHNKNNNRFNIYTNDDDHFSSNNNGFNINTFDDQHHSNNNRFNIYTNVPIWNPNETTNPGYAPSSSSSYEVFVRIAEGAS